MGLGNTWRSGGDERDSTCDSAKSRSVLESQGRHYIVSMSPGSLILLSDHRPARQRDTASAAGHVQFSVNPRIAAPSAVAAAGPRHLRSGRCWRLAVLVPGGGRGDVSDAFVVATAACPLLSTPSATAGGFLVASSPVLAPYLSLTGADAAFRGHPTSILSQASLPWRAFLFRALLPTQWRPPPLLPPSPRPLLAPPPQPPLQLILSIQCCSSATVAARRGS